MRIFFFGSLMDRDFLGLVLGREVDGLVLEPAVLRGFQRRRAKGETFPILVPHVDGRVDGVVVEGFAPEDVARLSYYETTDYALHPFPVETAEHRREAHVFLATEKLEAEDHDWHYEHWRVTEKPLGLLLAAELMAHYERGTPMGEVDRLWPGIKAACEARLLIGLDVGAANAARG
jgi:hypothetical protein